MEYIFVTVNYNGYNHTEEFVKSINKLKVEKNDIVKIIIVNNYSTQEDLKKHKNLVLQHQNITLVESKENLGYFGGMNLGLKEIQNKKDKTILICNNDLTFDSNFILEYKKIIYDSNIFLLAPNIITKDGRMQNPLLVNKISKLRILQADIYASNYYIASFFKIIYSILRRFKKSNAKLTNNYEQMVIEAGIGACYIITEHFWEKFDELDNKVFLWGEEAVLSHQISQEDGQTLYVPTLKIIHHESASVGLIPSRKKYEILKESYKVYRKYL